MTIAERYNEITKGRDAAAVRSGREPEEITVMAVTKLHSAHEINEVIDAGATDIGENKVQELLDKYDKVKPVRWHLIGHLQTNKVKSIIDKVVMIHSVDSLRLAREIDKRAANAGVIMDVLIQINIGEEATKSGIYPDELISFAEELVDYRNLRLRGLMCIPPVSDNLEMTRAYFRQMNEMFLALAENLKKNKNASEIDTLSMGMSGDFETAIEEGATIVRVGSAIFGARDYR